MIATHLFDPWKLGPHHLPSRVVMTPMTRSRTSQPGDIPNALMAEYYAQRASAGLIITEATQISQQGQGYSFTPGVYTEAQVEGWRLVTDAVHAAGGRIFLQLWHVGRMSHPSFHADGQPVAPSAIAPGAAVWVVEPGSAKGTMLECPTPRALSVEEIQAVVEDYRQAAANAIRAGFDGVELHGANGYLIDQFLRATANHREDAYGGSVEGRMRFVEEVLRAVAAEIGAERVGLRLSPFITQRGMDDPDAPEMALRVAALMDRLGVAYLHLAEADWDDAPAIPARFRERLRASYSGTIIVAGGYDVTRAEALLSQGLVDLVGFGRAFIANPDLPARLASGARLATPDLSLAFGGGAEGYTDYPTAHATSGEGSSAR